MVEAIKNSRFRIEMIEHIKSNGKIESAYDSYAVLDGNCLEMFFARQVVSNQQIEYLNHGYDNAEIRNFNIRKKNMTFTIAGWMNPPAQPPKFMNKVFIYISARTDSDICMVDISYDRGGSTYYRFRGRIVPLQ